MFLSCARNWEISNEYKSFYMAVADIALRLMEIYFYVCHKEVSYNSKRTSNYKSIRLHFLRCFRFYFKAVHSWQKILSCIVIFDVMK